MQKVIAGNIGTLPEFADFLNRQLHNNPGWKIDKIYQIRQNYSVGVVVIFVGPDGTDGPSLRSGSAAGKDNATCDSDHAE